mmetsp:Transcript_69268/g.137353  ORF Transcript_69268/g.137353 Transcript_69268/m.137353 type:complete len:124 (+) Transcript_69268:292-663(+)
MLLISIECHSSPPLYMCTIITQLHTLVHACDTYASRDGDVQQSDGLLASPACLNPHCHAGVLIALRPVSPRHHDAASEICPPLHACQQHSNSTSSTYCLGAPLLAISSASVPPPCRHITSSTA